MNDPGRQRQAGDAPKASSASVLKEPAIDVAANLASVRARIAGACTAAGRDPATVRLVAVSKQQAETRVRAALEAGHRRFGENRVQEAKARWTTLRSEFPDLVLHLIGPLQTNKAADAVAFFHVIESVDREKLARSLAREMERTGRRPDCLVQVNTGAEPQKAGVLPEHADGLIRVCRDEIGLPLTGLMCIPPLGEEPSPHFALLAKIAARNGLSELSMGMSDDYETAVAFGATEVRVGTGIFGTRAG
ncbi:MAG: YggS family pyridoxal phosphate-dependent enzyme [Alphaproteobacteria bacterium]